MISYELNSNVSEQIRISSGAMSTIYESQDSENGDKPIQQISLSAKENDDLQLFISLNRSYDNFGQASEYSTTTINNGLNVLNSYYQLVPQYDANDRLVQIQKNRKSYLNNQVISQTDYYNQYNFALNSNNNIQEFSQQITPATNPVKRTVGSYSADDRLLSLTGSINRGYAYDDDGNLKTMTNCHGVTGYEYDDFSNLKKITYPDGKIIEYKVDGMNRRVKKIVNGITKEYYIWYDQIHLAAILDANKVVKLTYLYGPNQALQVIW
ncbi:MAG: RHS repeat domain-containing protein [Pseudobdellovibrio sp.]